MAAMTVLIYPKCQGAMRTYERSGVVIDQCTDCRGIFLDHGELERLVDAMTMPDTHGDEEHERERERDDRRGHVPEIGNDDWRGRDSRGRPVEGARRRENRFGVILDIFGD